MINTIMTIMSNNEENSALKQESFKFETTFNKETVN